MYFIFDVETIPDFKFLRQVIENPEKQEDDLLIQAQTQLGHDSSDILPPMYQRIISWAGLWIENNGAPKQKISWHGKEEKEGLQSLFNSLSTYKDFGLIHYNGRSFDLPLLTYRAMKYGLQMPLRLNHYDIKYRYSNQNVDLLDEFSNYGASSWPTLKHLRHLIDLPFKKAGKDHNVLNMFRQDKFSEIEHYCYEEVMGTYIVWLHLRYTVGEIAQDLFENLKDRAMQKLNEIQSTD